MYIIENADGVQFLNKLLTSADATNAGLQVGNAAADPSSPSNGDLYYNTGDNTLRYYNGTSWEVIASGVISSSLPIQFNVNSDDVVSAAAIFQGYINIDTGSEVINSTRLSSVDYETSIDGGDTWTTHTTISTLKTWVDSNITLNTTVFLIRAIAVYAAAQSGEAEVKFEYTPETL